MRTITRVALARRPRSDKPISHCYETVAKQLCLCQESMNFPSRCRCLPSLSLLSVRVIISNIKCQSKVPSHALIRIVPVSLGTRNNIILRLGDRREKICYIVYRTFSFSHLLKSQNNIGYRHSNWNILTLPSVIPYLKKKKKNIDYRCNYNDVDITVVTCIIRGPFSCTPTLTSNYFRRHVTDA